MKLGEIPAALHSSVSMCMARANFFADSDDDVAEDGLSAGAGGLDRNDLLVFKTVFLGVGGGHVDVALGADYAVVKLDLACGADKLTSVGAFGVARLANEGVNPDGTGVGEGNLNLGLGTNGSENGNAFKLSLGADDGYSLFAGKLAGLGKVLLGVSS